MNPKYKISTDKVICDHLAECEAGTAAVTVVPTNTTCAKRDVIVTACDKQRRTVTVQDGDGKTTWSFDNILIPA